MSRKLEVVCTARRFVDCYYNQSYLRCRPTGCAAVQQAKEIYDRLERGNGRKPDSKKVQEVLNKWVREGGIFDDDCEYTVTAYE